MYKIIDVTSLYQFHLISSFFALMLMNISWKFAKFSKSWECLNYVTLIFREFSNVDDQGEGEGGGQMVSENLAIFTVWVQTEGVRKGGGTWSWQGEWNRVSVRALSLPSDTALVLAIRTRARRSQHFRPGIWKGPLLLRMINIILLPLPELELRSNLTTASTRTSQKMNQPWNRWCLPFYMYAFRESYTKSSIR